MLAEKVQVVRTQYICGACGSYVKAEAHECPSCGASLLTRA